MVWVAGVAGTICFSDGTVGVSSEVKVRFPRAYHCE